MFDIRAAKDGLILLLAGCPGLQQVFDGAPESMPVQAAAWVTVGGLDQRVRSVAAGGVYELDVNLLVTIGYVLQGNEEAGEDNVAAAIGEITRRVLQNRVGTVGGVAPMLGGTVKTMEPPGPATGVSDYITIAGQESRAYPIAILITLRETIT